MRPSPETAGQAFLRITRQVNADLGRILNRGGLFMPPEELENEENEEEEEIQLLGEDTLQQIREMRDELNDIEGVEVSFDSVEVSIERDGEVITTGPLEIGDITDDSSPTMADTVDESEGQPATAEDLLRGIAGLPGNGANADDRGTEPGAPVIRRRDEVPHRLEDAPNRNNVRMNFATTATSHGHDMCHLGLRSMTGENIVLALEFHPTVYGARIGWYPKPGYYITMSYGTVERVRAQRRVNVTHTELPDNVGSVNDRRQYYPRKVIFLRESASFRRATFNRLKFAHFTAGSAVCQELWYRLKWEDENL